MINLSPEKISHINVLKKSLWKEFFIRLYLVKQRSYIIYFRP